VFINTVKHAWYTCNGVAAQLNTPGIRDGVAAQLNTPGIRDGVAAQFNTPGKRDGVVAHLYIYTKA